MGRGSQCRPACEVCVLCHVTGLSLPSATQRPWGLTGPQAAKAEKSGLCTGRGVAGATPAGPTSLSRKHEGSQERPSYRSPHAGLLSLPGDTCTKVPFHLLSRQTPAGVKQMKPLSPRILVERKKNVPAVSF